MTLEFRDITAAVCDGRILINRCQRCSTEQAFPSSTCFACGSDFLERIEHSGRGELYSWTTTHIAFQPENIPQTPYTVIVVRLTGGARIYGRLLDDNQEPTQAGMMLRLDIEATKRERALIFRSDLPDNQ